MDHIYDRLGVRRVINAADTYTYVGGSLMPPEVLDTMKQASERYVQIDELQQRVGERIAQLTRNEAAFVTCGAAAALALATAACVAGKDPGRIEQLPDTTGMKNEVVVHRCQRNPYDHAIRQVGVKLVEFGYFDETHRHQLEAAITDKTAAIFYFAGTSFERGALPLPVVIDVAKERGIPVIVDAAAQLPPVDNLWNYTQMGADLVIFSGGKGVRGPQSSGLLLGRAELIEACALHTSPHHALGRSMKVGKEEIVGLLTALERFLSQDWEAVNAKWEQIVSYAVNELSGVPGVQAERIYPARLGQHYPRAKITWDPGFGISRAELVQRLMSGDPAVLVGELENSTDAIYINPIVLGEGDEIEVVSRLKDIFQSRSGPVA